MSEYVRHDCDPPAPMPQTGMPIDELIRPGLHLAYPLHPEGDTSEDRFRPLLDALSRQEQRRS